MTDGVDGFGQGLKKKFTPSKSPPKGETSKFESPPQRGGLGGVYFAFANPSVHDASSGFISRPFSKQARASVFLPSIR